MRKKITLTLLITAMLLITAVFSGCDSTQSVPAGETKTITDCAGRNVTIPKNPQRVGCMFASTAHMMAMLGEEDKIVGTPNGVKSDVLMQMKYPEIEDVAIPYQEGSINIEELIRIKADIALIRFTTAAAQGEVEKLENAGIPYVVVDYRNMKELNKAVEVMGKVFNKEEKAQAYIDFAGETIDMVGERLADVPEDSRPLVYHTANEAIRTDGEGDICGEIMNMAAVRNISIEKGVKGGGDKTYTTLEEIYNWDPEAFIANEYSVTEYILSDSKWAGLSAVKDKKVYTLPVGATRWCHPGSMEAHMGVLAVAVMFYPEKFTDFDMNQYVADYYRTYFGLELDSATVKQILSGKGMRLSNSPVN